MKNIIQQQQQEIYNTTTKIYIHMTCETNEENHIMIFCFVCCLCYLLRHNTHSLWCNKTKWQFYLKLLYFYLFWWSFEAWSIYTMSEKGYHVANRHGITIAKSNNHNKNEELKIILGVCVGLKKQSSVL